MNRTTNGFGNLADVSPEYLRGLDAGGGEPIPFLEEVIALVDGRVPLNVERSTPKPPRPRWKSSSYSPSRVSSSPHSSRKLSRKAREVAGPELPLGVLFHDPPADFGPIWDLCDELSAWSLHPFFPHATASLVRAAHNRALLVYAYTVNDPREALRLRELGVQGVFTDFPDKLQNLRILAE